MEAAAKPLRIDKTAPGRTEAEPWGDIQAQEHAEEEPTRETEK